MGFVQDLKKNYAIHLITLEQSKYTRNRQKSGVPVPLPFDTLLPAHSPSTHRHGLHVHSKGQQHSSNDFSSDSNIIPRSKLRYHHTNSHSQRDHLQRYCYSRPYPHAHSSILHTTTTQTLSYQGYTWMQQRHISRTYITYIATQPGFGIIIVIIILIIIAINKVY